MNIEGPKKRKSTIPNKKLPKNGYTGHDDDRPGPEVYNPSINFVKSKSMACLFSRSKAKRDIGNNSRSQI